MKTLVLVELSAQIVEFVTQLALQSAGLVVRLYEQRTNTADYQ